MKGRKWRVTPVVGTSKISYWDLHADELSVGDGVLKFYNVTPSPLPGGGFDREIASVIPLRNIMEVENLGEVED